MVQKKNKKHPGSGGLEIRRIRPACFKLTPIQIITLDNCGEQKCISAHTPHRNLRTMSYKRRKPHRVAPLSAKNGHLRRQCYFSFVWLPVCQHRFSFCQFLTSSSLCCFSSALYLSKLPWQSALLCKPANLCRITPTTQLRLCQWQWGLSTKVHAGRPKALLSEKWVGGGVATVRLDPPAGAQAVAATSATFL